MGDDDDDDDDNNDDERVDCLFGSSMGHHLPPICPYSPIRPSHRWFTSGREPQSCKASRHDDLFSNKNIGFWRIGPHLRYCVVNLLM
ncbi:hypothetical protein TCAL_15767 [Tigriopus californicus]|uniref:Uncharacterized protein n=1 Tax=Tigriopus californicus TaxID=6832 RepID=A0A553P834_TIGCA|nr:hypothetical protein TCAL_15767 [Tigriopus californicus]